MSKICYVPKKFSEDKLELISQANTIIASYSNRGYSLSLRQLYYQFVVRNLIPNEPREYDRLGDLVSDARMAGYIDWEAIVDRIRGLRYRENWEKPSHIIESAYEDYHINMWKDQPHYIEVHMEKNAVIDVVGKVCTDWDVPFFSNVGYNSTTGAWNTAQRLLGKIAQGKEVHILYLGDHDPSGIHMSQDLKGRFELFARREIHVQRIALNMSQVERMKLAPNTAKKKDPRYESYKKQFGKDSWELDAIDPLEMEKIVFDGIMRYLDKKVWAEAEKLKERGKNTMRYLCQYYPEIILWIRERRKQQESPTICQACGATEANPKCLCDEQTDSLTLMDRRLTNGAD